MNETEPGVLTWELLEEAYEKLSDPERQAEQMEWGRRYRNAAFTLYFRYKKVPTHNEIIKEMEKDDNSKSNKGTK